jgi:hypothetical protein
VNKLAEKKEEGFRAYPLVGLGQYDDPRKTLMSPKDRQDRIESNQRFDKMLKEANLRQWQAHHWVSEPKSPEQWDIILYEAAKAGKTLKDFEIIQRNIQLENEKAAEQQRQRQIENEVQTKERNRFSNRFLRECEYLKIKVPYERNLTEAATQAPTAELLEAQTRLLQRERPELNDESRNFALNWLNVHIQKRQNNDNQENPLKKARSIFDMFRGH